MLEPRLVVNQCYILQESLGEDSFAELWRASSIYSATQFLIRFLKEGKNLEAGVPEFRKQAMECYSIQSSAVMDFVEVERFGDRSFVAAEFDGQHHLLAHFGSLQQIRLEHACRFVIELGTGIDAFHKRGITYRCLNAENVLVTSPGGHIESIRVQKPGYAAFLDCLDEKDGRAAFENWGYMAPELKAGSGGSRTLGDRRSDIYSLAIHLFRFIVGKLPYSTAKRARTGAVSLSYVSKAFARRGVPLPVTRSVLKALRKDPRQRPSEVLELIAELRAFMDERRRELLAVGEDDPVAELATLNLGKDRVGAHQAVKSLDTADYFRQLSESWSTDQPKSPTLLFPVRDFAEPEEVARIEEGEAEGEDDDGRKSVDSYIEEAIRAVRNEAASHRPDGSRLELPKAMPVLPVSAAEAARQALEDEAKSREAAGRLAPQALSQGAGEAAAGEIEEAEALEDTLDPGDGSSGAEHLVSTPLSLDLGGRRKKAAAPRGKAPLVLSPEPPKARPATMGAFASDPGPARRRKGETVHEKVSAGGISWRPDMALPEVVVSGMESAFSRAFKGTGAFRFIQEPPPGPGAVAFARVFATFRARGLVADLGTLPQRADATDLLRLLRTAVATGLSYESPQARSALARRLRVSDREGTLAAAPLGALLTGRDGEEPDPDWLESTEGAMRAALAIASLGRRRRPLVLSMRGGEAMGQSCHAVLVELARLAPIASFCCFAFYKPVRVPSWHVLSRLGIKN